MQMDDVLQLLNSTRNLLIFQQLFDGHRDRFSEGLKAIAAFKGEDVRDGREVGRGPAQEDSADDAPHAFVCNIKPCQRVFYVDVVARGNEDDIGTEVLYKPRKDIPIGFVELFISGTEWHWNVIGAPFSLAPSALGIFPCTGIMGILVRAEVKHGVVFFKDMLGAVSVVDIEIDDEYSLVTDLLGITRTDSDVIEYAETHCSIGLGMVSGRTHRTEGALYVTAFAFVNCFNHSACGKHRRLTAMLRNIGVAVVKTGECPDSLKIVSGMNAKDVFFKGASGPDMNELFQKSEFLSVSQMWTSLWEDSGWPGGISCFRNMSS